MNKRMYLPPYVVPYLILLCVRDNQGALLALAVLPKAAPHPTGESKVVTAGDTFL